MNYDHTHTHTHTQNATQTTEFSDSGISLKNITL